jgi:hypothetical protein
MALEHLDGVRSAGNRKDDCVRSLDDWVGAREVSFWPKLSGHADERLIQAIFLGRFTPTASHRGPVTQERSQRGLELADVKRLS